MKTTVDILFMTGDCYDESKCPMVLPNMCVCCTMALIARDMILRGEY